MALIIVTLSPVTVSSAGNAVQLSSSSIFTSSATIQADVDNSGNIYIGDSSVTSSNGIELKPGDVYEFSGDDIRGIGEQIDLSDLYVDAATSNDSVRVTYFKRKNLYADSS